MGKERKERRTKRIEVSCDPNQIVSVIDWWFRNTFSDHDQPDYAHFVTRLPEVVRQMQQQQPGRESKVWGWEDEHAVGDEKPMLFAKADLLHGLWIYIDQPRQDDESYNQLEKLCQLYEDPVEVKIRRPRTSRASIPE